MCSGPPLNRQSDRPRSPLEFLDTDLTRSPDRSLEALLVLLVSGDEITSCLSASASTVGDLGLIPGSGRFPGEGNGNPLQYSYLENSMNREAWQATVLGVPKSWTQQSI